METIDHILDTPRGTTLIGAETLPQLEQTAMKEFFEIFPEELIEFYNRQKNYLVTTNGHTVIFRPLDAEQKARSLNLTFFWIEEANGIAFEYFTQLQTRLRNDRAKHRQGILSTNPDMNWVKTEFLMKAHVIYNSTTDYPRSEEDKNSDFAVHIGPTELNTYLPDDYFESTARGKPDWWVRRYLGGSFENKEGLVYPQYSDHIIEPFEIPEHWHRYIGGDFGLANPTAFPFIAINPENGEVIIYDEYKKSQLPLNDHAEYLLSKIDEFKYNVLKDMIGDAAGQQKTAQSASSVFDHYAEYGIYWTPGTKKLEDSIMKKYTYFELEKIKIFSSCIETIKEFSAYKYPERKLDQTVKNEDIFEKPIKKDDHLMDGIRYVIAELPDDPDQLINQSYNAQFVIQRGIMRKKTSIPHALQTNDRNSYSSSSWLGY